MSSWRYCNLRQLLDLKLRASEKRLKKKNLLLVAADKIDFYLARILRQPVYLFLSWRTLAAYPLIKTSVLLLRFVLFESLLSSRSRASFFAYWNLVWRNKGGDRPRRPRRCIAGPEGKRDRANSRSSGKGVNWNESLMRTTIPSLVLSSQLSLSRALQNYLAKYSARVSKTFRLFRNFFFLSSREKFESSLGEGGK